MDPAGRWETAEYERLAELALAAVTRHVDESLRGDKPVGAPPSLEELVGRLDLRRLARDGGLDAESFGPWLDKVLDHSVRLHHPAEMAHQVAAPDAARPAPACSSGRSSARRRRSARGSS
jgi:L-2,4-diaminobutyrate decarboxylase